MDTNKRKRPSNESKASAWKEYTIMFPYYPSTLQEVLRNRHHIQHLTIYFLEDECLETLASNLPTLPTQNNTRPNVTAPTKPRSTASTQPYARLQKLEINETLEIFEVFDSPDYAHQFLRVLPHFFNLVYLRMPYPMFLTSPSLRETFQTSLCTHLQKLEHLELSERSVSAKKTLPLMQACLLHPQLRVLNLDFGMRNDGYSDKSCAPERLRRSYNEEEDEDEDEEEEVEEDENDSDHEDYNDENIGSKFASTLESLGAASRSMGSFKSKITTFMLPVYEPGYPISFLIPLLRDHVPNIENLETSEIKNDTQMDIKDAIGGPIPRLQHITCPTSPSDMAIIKELIISCSQGLKTIQANDFEDDGHSSEPQHFVDTLIEHHSGNLEKIRFERCVAIKGEDIWKILTKCAKLERFWIEPAFKRKVSIDFDDILSHPWACHNLKELRLVLNPGNNAGNSESVGGLPPRSVARRVYAQIGQLVKLERLGLGWYEDEDADVRSKNFIMDLTLSQGWLSELAGLVELRYLILARIYWRAMGQAEIEFMDANWPHLEMIVIELDFAIDVFGAMDRHSRLPHWAWLQKRRPNLKYEYYVPSSRR
ncbi:hypothetical protein BGX27_000676 [Mortierella sp. AM989]|nr:hypothetical protein BGX27_000676 [Mortierella sp. AM989]